jgi:hypothetical protein
MDPPLQNGFHQPEYWQAEKTVFPIDLLYAST